MYIVLWILSKGKHWIVISVSKEVHTILSEKFMDLLLIACIWQNDHVSVSTHCHSIFSLIEYGGKNVLFIYLNIL